MTTCKRQVTRKEIPNEFSEDTKRAIKRIDQHHNVLGLLYLRNDCLEMYTVPENMVRFLSKRLPPLHSAMRNAITEIDVLDELVAIRIETKKIEIIATSDKDFLACDLKDEWLVTTTSSINKVNPVVDRIMDDESVEGVIMTNKEGAPILTNITLTGASNYGLRLQQFGSITQMYKKEMDPFDEVLIIRLHTKKLEIMFATNPEFNIVVLQHPRHKAKQQEKIKNVM
ncbi:hypothetical protein K1T71_012856 [Dendrolimus kikuchii]|uniref:Uncharacterized protein n=1 Tax=Dendrolimus kikuchii TaxID=765133 RepID=A0ACC1CIK1_9NEOP|nr:hypothetical protein K1T71_012856 [Dendrolimus kikuchii]